MGVQPRCQLGSVLKRGSLARLNLLDSFIGIYDWVCWLAWATAELVVALPKGKIKRNMGMVRITCVGATKAHDTPT